MSKLKDSMMVDRVNELEDKLIKAESYNKRMALELDVKKEEYATLQKRYSELRKLYDSTLKTQINKHEFEQLRIENSRAMINYSNIQKRLREMQKFVEGIMKGEIPSE